MLETFTRLSLFHLAGEGVQSVYNSSSFNIFFRNIGKVYIKVNSVLRCTDRV